MNLVDAARHVISTEPPEGKSIVHKLGESIACHQAWDIFTIQITEHSNTASEILSIDVREDGTLKDGCYTIIYKQLYPFKKDIITEPTNLPALANYILDHCLERIPADAIEELSQSKSSASNYKIA